MDSESSVHHAAELALVSERIRQKFFCGDQPWWFGEEISSENRKQSP